MRYLLIFFMAFSCFLFAQRKQSPGAEDKSKPLPSQKAAASNAAPPLFQMKYLDEIGHLNSDEDKRTSLDFGFAKVFVESDDGVRFEGRDDKGKPWHAWLLPDGGVGGTQVWTADFDKNGRRDLLICGFFPGNGRCIDRATIYVLMFDEAGRPVPWVADSNSFGGYDGEAPPLPVVEANGGKRAEIVILGCEYSDPQWGCLEDRRITGVYEARDARWIPMRKASVSPSLAAAKRHLGEEMLEEIRWLPTHPDRWPDFLTGFDSKPRGQMQSLDAKYIAIDLPEGRDIFLSEQLNLDNFPRKGYRFKVLGDRFSPGLLWVEGGADVHFDQIYKTPGIKRKG